MFNFYRLKLLIRAASIITLSLAIHISSVPVSFAASSDNNVISTVYPDSDSDGINDIEEGKLNTSPIEVDTDFDGIRDLDEIQKYFTDPTLSDTDADGLNDGVEILDFQSNPNSNDENSNGILDGEEERTIPLPDNSFGLTGYVTGKGPISRQISISKNPIILLDYIQSEYKVHIQSLNNSLTFNIQIAHSSIKKTNNLVLFKYDYHERKLSIVENQKKNKDFLEASFSGGGVLFLADKKTFDDYSLPKNSKLVTEKNYKYNGKIKIMNMPGLNIDSNLIKKTKIKKSGREIEANLINFQRVTKQSTNPKQNKTDNVYYELSNVYTDGISTYANLTALSNETGSKITIFVHGMAGGHGTWGFGNRWGNGTIGSGHQDSEAILNATNLSSNDTFTGTNYELGDELSYGELDSHFVTEIITPSNPDDKKLGARLVDDPNGNFLINENTFSFQYYKWDNIHPGAGFLKSFITNLYAEGLIGPLDEINLIAHSKGGLVSRYYIENQGGDSIVDRLITIATPHFGGKGAAYWSNLSRGGSCLWGTDDGCTPFTNDHGDTMYFFIGGFNPDKKYLTERLRDRIHFAPDTSDFGADLYGQPITHYIQDVRDIFNREGVSINRRLEPNSRTYIGYDNDGINDDYVRIDSSMGTDFYGNYKPKLPEVSSVEMKFYIFHDEYGQHSGLLKHERMPLFVEALLNYTQNSGGGIGGGSGDSPEATLISPSGNSSVPTIINNSRLTVTWDQTDLDLNTSIINFESFEIIVRDENDNYIWSSGEIVQHTNNESNSFVLPFDLPSGDKFKLFLLVKDWEGNWSEPSNIGWFIQNQQTEDGTSEQLAITFNPNKMQSISVPSSGIIWYKAYLSDGVSYAFNKSGGTLTIYDSNLNIISSINDSTGSFDFYPSSTETYYFKVEQSLGGNLTLGPADSGMTIGTSILFEVPEPTLSKKVNVWMGTIGQEGFTWNKAYFYKDQTYYFEKTGVEIQIYENNTLIQLVDEATSSFQFTPTYDGFYYFKANGISGEEWDLILQE